MPGTGGQGPGKRGWDTRQSLDTAGDISPLGVQGDEPAGQVGQDRPAASVPATVTACLSRASQICWAQAAWRRAPCFFSLTSMRALPAFFSAVGAVSGRYGLQDGVAGQEGSQDGLEGGAGSGCTSLECG